MVSLGMWACQWRELRPINFGGAGVGATNQTQGTQNESADEVTAGQSRGRGRGRNRDGFGDYEMVAMKEGADDAV